MLELIMAKEGRPTKYRPEINDELDKYLETTGSAKRKLPTIQGFSLWLGVNDDTLNEWTKTYPRFSATLERLKKLQAEQLIDDGTYDKSTNATIIKLLLQNNHGMRERRDITTDDQKLEGLVVVKSN